MHLYILHSKIAPVPQNRQQEVDDAHLRRKFTRRTLRCQKNRRRSMISFGPDVEQRAENPSHHSESVG